MMQGVMRFREKMSEVQQIELKKCDESSPYWREIECLFQSEWSNFNFSDTYTSCVELPPVIVALVGDEVIGEWF